MKTFTLDIITPEKHAYHSSGVYRLDIPTQAGEIGVLAHHTPLISLLKAGEMRVYTLDEGVLHMTVSSGVLKVRKNGEVIVLADTSERAEEIDVSRAEEARQRAEQILLEKEKLSVEDFAKFTGFLEKEIARIKVGSKGRK